MSYGKIKHLFPGGNTSLGFFSYYSNIMTQEEGNRFFIIKGGPGVGKSTFMKKIGEEMLQRGYDVEYLHCSSDNNSLDGIRVPDLQIAIIDGTSPHVVDPKSPGAVDEILNFGEFWDDEGIRRHKADIISTSTKISNIFARAYRYLKAADAVYEDSSTIYSRALIRGKLNKQVADLVNELFKDTGLAGEEGRDRKLFASAMTPGGLCHYLDSILTQEKIYELKGSMGTHEYEILDKLKIAAVERGFFVESFYCALRPNKIQHLVIPGLNVAITTSNDYHASSVEKTKTIDMQQFYKENILKEYQEELTENKNEFERLLSASLKTISKAKALHDQLESYYIPNIKFSMIDACFERTMAKIFNE